MNEENNYNEYDRVSSLIREVAPLYLERQHQRKVKTIKRLACCFVFFICLSGFTGYKIYDENSFQINTIEESYISSIGLPTDDYGFLEF